MRIGVGKQASFSLGNGSSNALIGAENNKLSWLYDYLRSVFLVEWIDVLRMVPVSDKTLPRRQFIFNLDKGLRHENMGGTDSGRGIELRRG